MSGKITKRVLNARGCTNAGVCMNFGGGDKKQGAPSTIGARNIVMSNLISRRTYHL